MRIKLILLLSNFLAFSTVVASALDCPAFPYFEPKVGPLAIVNCDFHTEYEDRVNQIIKTFGAPGGRPIILNLGGNLIWKYNGKTESVNITPADYHYLKSFLHATFTSYLILSNQTPGYLNDDAYNKIVEMKNHLNTARSSIPSLPLTDEQKTLSQNVALLTDSFLKKILLNRSYNPDEMTNYYRKIRPIMNQMLKESAKIELELLNNTINQWMSELSPQDQKQLGVVVATAHQARAEEISLQYFAKKLGYRLGQGALYEQNFVVLEDKFDEPSALKLLARHYLDRQAAQLILKDASRLQKDLLANAAKEIIN